MKTRELMNLGLPRGPIIRLAQECIADAARNGRGKKQIRGEVAALVENPGAYRSHPQLGPLAQALLGEGEYAAPNHPPTPPPRNEPVPWRQWGEDLDPSSVEQLHNACLLPISVRGALMPDAHVGYGLPIGGVLATENAVIPYAVGVDIACRMKLTVLDLPTTAIDGQTDRLINAIEAETRFGIGAKFSSPHDHPVLDEDWSVSPVTKQQKEKARSQLGSSGSGNHFVEFGLLEVLAGDEESGEDGGGESRGLGLEPGTYLALLSHSGSRGAGASVASHYSKLAMELHDDLPKALRHLAWLDLDSEPGQEYWHAMELMGRYAAANHACIHRAIAKHLGASGIADVENHHNFAWKEVHETPDGPREVVVHRKGATPAGAGVLGVIPGSMASPAYIVRGLGNEDSLKSASHGAGRVMSRRAAHSTLTWSDAKKLLAERNVRLLSAGLDEVPMVYKDINAVMAAQRDLVETIARFDPRIVKMAPAGEKPED